MKTLLRKCIGLPSSISSPSHIFLLHKKLHQKCDGANFTSYGGYGKLDMMRQWRHRIWCSVSWEHWIRRRDEGDQKDGSADGAGSGVTLLGSPRSDSGSEGDKRSEWRRQIWRSSSHDVLDLDLDSDGLIQ
ncbi:hypothetical protein OsI_23368 [Oryza sativa Indica Group]|uniref:Uncharacterized protein n=1 Tax=Oryza sativa subsp. indica TaxID=39946 RepID=A2YE23_ORYSI|nr:hypothetical protein OsI_23368 [Oryza sativa Indica Group]